MSDTADPGRPRPPVRLRPVPPIDPPFADETAEPYWPAPATVSSPSTCSRSTRRDPGPAARRAGAARAARCPAGPPPTRVAAGRAGDRPAEATRAAHRFVGTCLEVLNGYRSPGQVRAAARPGPRDRACWPSWPAPPPGPARSAAGRPGPVVRLLRLRVCEPRAAAVEVAAVLTGAGGRTWAMALRLEHRRGSWLCTALQVL